MDNDIGNTENPENHAASGLVRMSDIKPKEVRWLWPPYIPQAKLTLLRGDGSAGKTTLCLALAAIVSSGGLLPCGGQDVSGHHETGINQIDAHHTVTPGNVLFISAEDDLEDTIAPRLISAGADMGRVYSYIESTAEKLHYTSPLFEGLIMQSSPALVLVDPSQAFFGRADMNRANHVRPIMTHLRLLAEKYDCAIVLVEHLTKAGGGRGFHRGLGSIDITSAARSVLMVGNDPDNPDERGICHIKGNLGQLGRVVGFTIGDNGLSWNPGTYLTSDIIEGRTATRHRETGALTEAKEFLQNALSDGRRLCADVELDATESGISKRTLRRAREELGVDTERQGFGKAGYWNLPPAH
jgi:hypothetical protein